MSGYDNLSDDLYEIERDNRAEVAAMKAKNYEDWKLLGYQVTKGQKATGRDKNGKPTFTRDQVEEIEEGFDGEGDEGLA